MIETNIQFSDIFQALTEMASQTETDKKPISPIRYLAHNK